MLEKQRDAVVAFERREDSVLISISGHPRLTGDGKIEPVQLIVEQQSVKDAVNQAYEELTDIKPDLSLVRVKVEIKEIKQIRSTKKNGLRQSKEDNPRTHGELLTELLNTWCATPSVGNTYVFNKLVRRERDIYHIVLSGDIQTDGVYLLPDFKLFEITDRTTRVSVPYLRVNDSLLLNSFRRRTMARLRDDMIKRGFVTDEEFHQFFTNDKSVQKHLAKNMPMILWAD